MLLIIYGHVLALLYHHRHPTQDRSQHQNSDVVLPILSLAPVQLDLTCLTKLYLAVLRLVQPCCSPDVSFREFTTLNAEDDGRTVRASEARINVLSLKTHDMESSDVPVTKLQLSGKPTPIAASFQTDWSVWRSVPTGQY